MTRCQASRNNVKRTRNRAPNRRQFDIQHFEEAEQVREEDEELEELLDETVQHENNPQESAHLVRSDEILNGRVVHKTRAHYKSTMNYIIEYCSNNIKSAVTVRNGTALFIYPMSFENMKVFFAMMSLERPNKTVKSKSTLQGYVSTLKFFYQENKAEMSAECETYLSHFMSGYKRTVKAKKDSGVMKNYEGKVPVGFQLYCTLAKLALFAATCRSQLSGFIHCFMILCWVLFARSISVSTLRTNHMSWTNDSLVIELAGAKNDQAGEKQTPKHVYANIFMPEICPILSLALHIFSISYRESGSDNTKLFVGNAYDIFGGWLFEALSTITSLGFAVRDFGTHSFRKGVATFCTGFLGGPSTVAVFLRAGWSLGNVQDRYLFYCDGGDQLCGRIASGLNFNNGADFSALPPRFKETDPLTKEEWMEICPGYGNHPETFLVCLPYLLASIVHHYDWICKVDDHGNYINISKSHKIFQSQLFLSGIIQKLRPEVLGVNTSGRCEITGMTATGIPPHIDLARKVQLLTVENEMLRALTVQNHLEVMSTLPQEISDKVRDSILRNFHLEGVQQLSKDDVMNCMQAMFVDFANRIQPIVQSVSSLTTNTVNSSLDDNSGYTFWSWGGQLRPMPESYELPKINVKAICDMFMYGAPSQSIRPFRRIKTCDWKRIHQTYFSRADYVFSTICRYIVSLGMVLNCNAIYDLPYIEWDRVFASAYPLVITAIEEKKGKRLHKVGEMSYITMYDLFRKFLVPQQPV